jgi:hypothetical protein
MITKDSRTPRTSVGLGSSALKKILIFVTLVGTRQTSFARRAIDGFDRLRIAFVHGDADKRSIRDVHFPKHSRCHLFAPMSVPVPLIGVLQYWQMFE